jgi:hypothetical protein
MKKYPFTAKELNGKTVEYERDRFATAFGRIQATELEDGTLRIRLQVTTAANVPAPAPLQTLDPIHFQIHPNPERAQFLWAENPDELSRNM